MFSSCTFKCVNLFFDDYSFEQRSFFLSLIRLPILMYIFNSTGLPVGASQGSNFDPDLPEYVNYANLGYMIGRDLMHSLERYVFEKMENSVKKEKVRYDSSTQCLKSQFNNFTDELTKLKVRFECI